MSRKSKPLLAPDDWDRVYGEVDAILDDDAEKQTLAYQLVADWRAAEHAGDEQAERIVTALARYGALRVIHNRSRLETGIFVDSTVGRKQLIPVRASLEDREDTGAKTGYTNLRIWHEVTWEEFDDWVMGQLRLSDSMQFKVRGLRRIQRLRERFPDTKTPGEACRLAGIDPLSIEIGSIAA